MNAIMSHFFCDMFGVHVYTQSPDTNRLGVHVTGHGIGNEETVVTDDYRTYDSRLGTYLTEQSLQVLRGFNSQYAHLAVIEISIGQLANFVQIFLIQEKLPYGSNSAGSGVLVGIS